MLMCAAGKADYFGSTVNRAARVWAAAQAGQVSNLCLSELTSPARVGLAISLDDLKGAVSALMLMRRQEWMHSICSKG